ncbi:MarR family transcriptional regulator [Streptosporangium sp. NBC_01639]|uniref:MarR family winged helix-turn-helix transcriptional regulator n=1 Tax=Streptosporangium sp. NBC_01639 TaxID=2975948 RepID=UPI00386597C7|nr:MarR family transcriptional regulator [Streptosporangium sp. NBC_01639]
METTADDATPARLKGTPSWVLTHTATHAGRLLWEAFSTTDARRYHYALLAALEEFGPASQASLGRRCGIDRSYIVGAINELAAWGLVERDPDPADRRRNVITLTPAGGERLRELDEILAGVQDAIFAPLSSEERDQLTRLLARVLEYHDHRRGPSV